ncbi:MAG: hypothetical protein ACOCWK_09395 [Tangfeifania sp.]
MNKVHLSRPDSSGGLFMNNPGERIKLMIIKQVEGYNVLIGFARKFRLQKV